MKKLIAFVGAMLFAFFTVAAHAATDKDKATVKDAETMVQKAIAFYKKNGKEKSMAEFARMPGPFVDRDVYVTVYNEAGDCLAHINPKMVNKNMMDLRDANGVYHIKERMDASRKGTSGWQDIAFFNPVSKKIEPKRIYWEKYDNLVFAAGAYKPQ
jgi:cytochrome c